MIEQWLPGIENILDVSATLGAVVTAIVYRTELAMLLRRPLKELAEFLHLPLKEKVTLLEYAMLTWFMFLVLFFTIIIGLKMIFEKSVWQ